VTSANSIVRVKAHSHRWSDPPLLDHGRQVVTKAPTPDRPVDGFDIALMVLFLVGLYLGVSLQITSKVPLTSAPSGFAGLIMLWRRRAQMKPEHLGGLLVILSFYVGSILTASNVSFLDKRLTGLLQLTYSLVIGYGLFLTMIQANRQQVAAVLLAFCCCIVAGCALETYGGLRPFSDKVRAYLYSYDLVYNSDRRDEVLYGRIRPKLFTSEPSAVTFAYTYLSSVWLVTCSWRFKYLVYVGLVAAALVLLPGPTLVLMLLLVVPYFVFLSEGEKPNSPTRFIRMLALSGIVVVSAAMIGTVFFAERIRVLQAGGDASFFYRFTGPMLVAFDMFRHHPMAGSGLTGEPSIVDQVTNVYMNSPSFHTGWRVTKIGESLTNYFWLHWIYLGLGWGIALLAGFWFWLRQLRVPSVMYCCAIWVIMGQASGAYVGPKTWAVLMIAAASSILVTRPNASAMSRPFTLRRPLQRGVLKPQVKEAAA
jgi:hypothetical protein